LIIQFDHQFITLIVIVKNQKISKSLVLLILTKAQITIVRKVYPNIGAIIVINDKIIEKEPIKILIWRCHFGKLLFINANPIVIHPIIIKVKINNIYINSVLNVGSAVLSNIVTEVSSIKIMAGRILLILCKKLRNIGDRLKIIVISELLNRKIIIIIVISCKTFVGLRNANMRCIPITTEKTIVSGLIALRSLKSIIVC